MNRPSASRFLVFVSVSFCAGLVPFQYAGAQEASREEILDSEEWKKTMHDLEEWCSVQQIYDKDQMAKLKQRLEQKVAGMSADQMSDFIKQLKQKLTILHSPEAREARKWLSETLAVAAPAYADKIRAKLPDIATSTAAQLQLQLDAFEDRIAEKRKNSADFAKQRANQVKQIREQRIRDQQARLQSDLAADAAPRSNYNVFSTPGHVRTYARPYAYPLLWGGYRW